MAMKMRLVDNLRIIGAITAKDMLEALKNRTTLAVIVISIFMVLVYRSNPEAILSGSVTQVLVYDAGETAYWEDLDASTVFEVHGPYTSQMQMEADLVRGISPEIGLKIPADFDQQIAAGGNVEVQGFVMRWVGDAKASELASAAEGLLAEAVGHPVRVAVEGNQLYPSLDGFGFGMWYSMGLVIGILMVGTTMTPHLMIEERQSKTMDALLTSPASNSHVVIAKAITGISYCFLLVVLGAILASSLVVHWWLFILAALVGSLFSVAIGLLLGTIFETREQMTAWGFFLSFPLMLPLFLSWMKGLVPDAVIAILRWIPTVQMGRICRVSFAEKAYLADFGLEVLLVTGWALVLIGGVVWALRRSDR